MALFDTIFSGDGKVAEALVSLFGRQVTYRRWNEVAGGYDPMTGGTSGAYTEHTITATPFTAWKKATMEDNSVLAGDLRTLVSPVEVTWDVTNERDQIVDSLGRVYNIVSHRDVNTGDLSALLPLQLRMAS